MHCMVLLQCMFLLPNIAFFDHNNFRDGEIRVEVWSLRIMSSRAVREERFFERLRDFKSCQKWRATGQLTKVERPGMTLSKVIVLAELEALREMTREMTMRSGTPISVELGGNYY